MDLTPEQVDEIATQNCPHCRAGKPVRMMEHSGEFVHDIQIGSAKGVALCLSNGLRGGRHAS